jgi:hypothetical protein
MSIYVSMDILCCDFTNKRYKRPVQGAGVVARGATGRWCVVMWIGPEYLEKCGITPMEYHDACKYVEQRDGYVDF